MPTSKADQYRTWFKYERESHARVVEALRSVPRELRSHESFDRAVGLLGHLAAARRLWLFRLGESVEAPSLDQFFPKNLDLQELAARLEEVQEIWSAYLSRLTDADLERVFEYRSLEGEPFRNRVEDILAQLFGHSSYHRGQIALLMRSMGAEPAVTDYVFWTRERRPEPERAG